MSVIGPSGREAAGFTGTARVAAVIPALNEEQAIADVVRALLETSVGLVVVVDGGSDDATAERAAHAGATVVVERRRGYGRACLTGARHAAGADILVFLDGDGSDVPAQVPRLVGPIAAGHADLVIGSRTRGRRERGSVAPHQLLGNRLVCAVLRVRHGVGLTDIGPFRAVRADILDGLDMLEMTYGWPTEMIVRAARRGHRIWEVPVDYRTRNGGRSKVSGDLRASAAAGWRMLRVAWRTR